MGKGSAYERKFNNVVDEADGWATGRISGSGSGTDENRVDIVCGNGTYQWAVEAKYSSSPNIYLDEEEVTQIVSWAECVGVMAVLAPRWNSREVDGVEADWYIVPPFEAGRTPSGNYSLNAQTVAESYPALSEFL